MSAAKSGAWIVEEFDTWCDSLATHAVEAEDAHDAAHAAADLIVARDQYGDLRRRPFGEYFPLASLRVTLDDEEPGEPVTFEASALKDRGHYGVGFDVECIEQKAAVS